MNKLTTILLISTALTLSACGQAGEQWLNPDKEFALFDQPQVKGINATQEEMAKEAAANGDYPRAAQFYQQMIASGKGTPEEIFRYKYGMADATRRIGEAESSLTMFEELYKEKPDNIDVMEGRALTLMATGKTTDAGRAFEEVMQKDDKRWRTLNALGILFVTKNMIPEAMAYYEAALNASPDNAAILNNVGLSRAVDRNYPRAIEALQQASRVSKSPAQKKQIELNLAMVHGVAGDMDSAREMASKYMEGAALDNNLGLYAHLAKDNNLAKTYLNMALSQSPTYYERAWENLNTVGHSNRDDTPEAVLPPAAEKTPPKPDAVKPAPHGEKKRSSKGKRKTSYLLEEQKFEAATSTYSYAAPDSKSDMNDDKKSELSSDKDPKLSNDIKPELKSDAINPLPKDSKAKLNKDKTHKTKKSRDKSDAINTLPTDSKPSLSSDTVPEEKLPAD